MKYKIVGILSIIIGLLILPFIFTFPLKKPIEEILLTQPAISLINNGIPEEVIRSYDSTSTGNFVIGYNVVAISQESEWTIKFKPRKTLEGLWRGENPEISLLEQKKDTLKNFDCFPFKKIQGKTTTKEWVWVSAKASKVRPYFKVKLPKPNPNCLHSGIKFHANMDFIFPYNAKMSGYKNSTKNLERELNFFVITEQEMSILQELFPDNRVDLWIRIMAIIFDILFFGLMGLIGLKVI